MASKGRPTHADASSPHVDRAADASEANEVSLQITPYRDGYLIQGDITLSNTELKDFAKWNPRLGGWTISRRRAYEYDHQYGLRLFSK